MAPSILLPPAAAGPADASKTSDAPANDGDAPTERLSGNPRCGNAITESGEQCDDGNTENCDGCSRRCQLETNYDGCWGTPVGTFVNTCGNGILLPDESCDDGNTAADDGCAADCKQVDPGYRCRVPGKPCRPICGDGIVKDDEPCDDGNSASGDGCSTSCLTEPGWDCAGGACVRVAAVDGGSLDGGLGYLFCGDGIVSGAEECDILPSDYDYRFLNQYGGCTTECRWGAFCGDGALDADHEVCDLGRSNGARDSKGAGCTIGCTRFHYCGDGYVDTDLGEECDLGERNGSASDCSSVCQIWMP